MTVDEIKAAIEQLSEPERKELADWIEQVEEAAWDAEMEQDFSPGGRGHDLAGRIDRDIDKGKFSPLEEGLRSRQRQR
jgi:hypothetical protein